MSKPRLLLAALLLANLVYFAWTQGGLAMFGLVPAAFAEHEPQRMTQQIRPGALQIRNEAAAAAAAPVPATPVEPAEPAASTP
ncbi:MAG: sporulation protein [Variovorax sp.]